MASQHHFYVCLTSRTYSSSFSAFTVTTADAVTRGRTVLAHALALTVVVRLLADIRPPPSSPTSSPSPATTATATLSPAVATATVAAQRLTSGSARVLARGPAVRSRWSGNGSGTESANGRETESAAPSSSPRRNTSTSEEAVTVETGERGRGPGPTTGTGRESAATRANTTAAVATRDTATAAETTPPPPNTHHQQAISRTDGHWSISSILKIKIILACFPNAQCAKWVQLRVFAFDDVTSCEFFWRLTKWLHLNY